MSTGWIKVSLLYGSVIWVVVKLASNVMSMKAFKSVMSTSDILIVSSVGETCVDVIAMSSGDITDDVLFIMTLVIVSSLKGNSCAVLDMFVLNVVSFSTSDVLFTVTSLLKSVCSLPPFDHDSGTKSTKCVLLVTVAAMFPSSCAVTTLIAANVTIL